MPGWLDKKYATPSPRTKSKYSETEIYASGIARPTTDSITKKPLTKNDAYHAFR